MSGTPLHFSFGIEEELLLLDMADWAPADFTRLRFEDAERIVRRLPEYPADRAQLRIGDGGIKRTRWYVEGFERFTSSEQPVDCPPKGIEIRTTIHPTIRGAVAELTASTALLRRAAAIDGLVPVALGHHPLRAEFVPDPPLNGYELVRRQRSPEQRTATIPMVTYGPDLNLSVRPDGGVPDDRQAVDLARKLTWYSPGLAVFALNSPFRDGRRWAGLSARTHLRTGTRPAALAFVLDPANLTDTDPSLTKRARLPAEAGRVEYKALDAVGDPALYAALLALCKGLALDQTLPGRADVPDRGLHQLAARHGLDSAPVRELAAAVLAAAHTALNPASDPDAELLAPLDRMFHTGRVPAHDLIDLYDRLGSVGAVLAELGRRAQAPGPASSVHRTP